MCVGEGSPFTSYSPLSYYPCCCVLRLRLIASRPWGMGVWAIFMMKHEQLLRKAQAVALSPLRFILHGVSQSQRQSQPGEERHSAIPFLLAWSSIPCSCDSAMCSTLSWVHCINIRFIFIHFIRNRNYINAEQGWLAGWPRRDTTWARERMETLPSLSVWLVVDSIQGNQRHQRRPWSRQRRRVLVQNFYPPCTPPSSNGGGGREWIECSCTVSTQIPKSIISQTDFTLPRE